MVVHTTRVCQKTQHSIFSTVTFNDTIFTELLVPASRKIEAIKRILQKAYPASRHVGWNVYHSTCR